MIRSEQDFFMQNHVRSLVLNTANILYYRCSDLQILLIEANSLSKTFVRCKTFLGIDSHDSER